LLLPEHVDEPWRRQSAWVRVDYAGANDAIARNAKKNSRTPGADFNAVYRGKVLQLHFTVENEGLMTKIRCPALM
jgi:hypothetical protein